MRFCEECGAQLEDNAKFCEECGAEQEPIVAETIPEKEPVKAEQPEASVAADSEYGFCEECGARIRLADAFCESCGTAIVRGDAPVVQMDTITEVKQSVDAAVLNENTNVSVTQAEKLPASKPVLWIALALIGILIFAAGGYLLGSGRIGGSKKETETASHLSENTIPTVTSAVTAAPQIPTDVPESVPSVTPTTVVTPSPVPDTEAIPVSIFEGFRAIEHLGSVVTIEAPDGLTVVLDTTSKPECFGYISDGEHSFSFKFREDGTVRYPENYYNQEDLPENGHAIHVEFRDRAYVYWSYQQNGESEVYYDGWIPSQYTECIGQYTRSFANSLKQFETSGKVNTSSPFTRISDGEVIEVVYTGDNKENFSLGLLYNHEEDILRMELYNYETESYLCGYADGQIYYGEDTVYCLEPVFVDDGVYWEEIPYTLVDGEKQYDLSAYDVFCEVSMHVTEEGITVYWSAYEYGYMTVFYDDFFDAKNLQRKAYVNHY